MASRVVQLWLSVSKPVPADGLCPVCFLPSVVLVESKVLVSTGVRVREHFCCRDCGKVEGVV